MEMAQMKQTKVNRTYFKRLLIAFLCISVIPLGICVIAILIINYKITSEEYQKKTIELSNSGIQKIEKLIEEYNNIVSSLSRETGVMDALSEDDQAALYKAESIFTSLITGREGNIELHVLDYDSAVSYDTDRKPNLYDLSIYKDWGVFYEMKNNPMVPVYFPNNYVSNKNRQVCLSIGKAILNQKKEFIGYALLDIYQSTIENLIEPFDSEDTGYILTDQSNCIILDTTSYYREGFSISEKQKNQWHTKNVNYLSGKKTKTFIEVNTGQHEFSLYTFVTIPEYSKQISLLIRISLFVVAGAMLLCVIIAQTLARKLYQPMDKVVAAMKEIGNGHLQIRMEEKEKAGEDVNMVARGFNKMADQINYLLEAVVEQSERQKAAEMKALQAQISPHFLYNMLNEIKALAKLGRTEEVSSFVINLGKLLRHSISNQEKYVMVKEDLEFVNAYLDLQKIRYENSFRVMLNIDDAILSCKIPNLILQPIIENAIVHGIDGADSHPVIRISGYTNGLDRVIFEIYDNGVGVDEDYIHYINNTGKSYGLYGGLGLENVQKRLLLTYGPQYGVKIESQKGYYTKVIITLPFHQEDKKKQEAKP